jgi:hypothetical protein
MEIRCPPYTQFFRHPSSFVMVGNQGANKIIKTINNVLKNNNSHD